MLPAHESAPVVRDLYVLPLNDHSDLDATCMHDVDVPVVNVYQHFWSRHGTKQLRIHPSTR